MHDDPAADRPQLRPLRVQQPGEPVVRPSTEPRPARAENYHDAASVPEALNSTASRVRPRYASSKEARCAASSVKARRLRPSRATIASTGQASDREHGRTGGLHQGPSPAEDPLRRRRRRGGFFGRATRPAACAGQQLANAGVGDDAAPADRRPRGRRRPPTRSSGGLETSTVRPSGGQGCEQACGSIPCSLGSRPLKGSSSISAGWVAEQRHRDAEPLRHPQGEATGPPAPRGVAQADLGEDVVGRVCGSPWLWQSQRTWLRAVRLGCRAPGLTASRAGAAASFRLRYGRPPTRARPALGMSKPRTTRIVVDLPAPFGRRSRSPRPARREPHPVQGRCPDRPLAQPRDLDLTSTTYFSPSRRAPRGPRLPRAGA